MNYSIRYSYDGNLERKIKNGKFIPYTIFPGTKYKEGKWYYNDRENLIFKVISTAYNSKSELENIIVKSEECNYSLLCTDLDFYTDYMLIKDKNNIASQYIINNNKSYTGAEIVYWFFINNINASMTKYKGFWKYIDKYSRYRINDYNKYFLVSNVDKNGNNVSCCMIKDNSSIIRHRKTLKREYKIINDNFMKNQVEKDRNRIKNKCQ